MGEVVPSLHRLSAPVRLTAAHDVSQFDSGRPSLDDWLRQRAIGSLTAITFVVAEGPVVRGYYCLAAGSVARADMPRHIRRNTPEQVPLILIGRLARDVRYRGTGLGGDLLRDALRRIMNATQDVGARAVMVHALDDEAERFWQRFGFLRFPADSLTFFLPVETIVDAL